MEFASAVFRDILSPLAAFKDIRAQEEGFCSGRDAPTTLNSDQTIHGLDSVQATSSPRHRSPKLEDKVPLSTPCIPTTHEAVLEHRWTIQGADPDARRFFAVPQFALGKPPLRVDVYLPPLEDYLPEVRDLLKPEEVIYAPRAEIPSLRISRWLAGVLEQWSVAYDKSSSVRRSECLNGGGGVIGKFQREYESMPFGSRILVTLGGLSSSPAEMTIDHEIHLVRDYAVEQGMLTVDSLREMWRNVDVNAPAGQSSWPEVLDLEDLQLKRQFHEAISVVTINPSRHTPPPADAQNRPPEAEKEWIFKSLTRDQRYLYNELKMLLSLRPNESIIPRPRYIVTKKGRFGARKGVCGFVLEYFPGGSLKQFLLEKTSSSPSTSTCISLGQKIRWARQITRALVHINTNADINNQRNGSVDGDVSRSQQWFGFYPDLKPDNIVLRPSSSTTTSTRGCGGNDSYCSENELLYDAVLIDLEQRGGWFSWSPPEIGYLEYLETIVAADVNELDGQGYDIDQLEEVQDEVRGLLGEYYSLCFDQTGMGLGIGESQTSGGNSNLRYSNSDGGFSMPWLALLAKRRAAATITRQVNMKPSDYGNGAHDLEKAQVFMLGKLLWCIFEEDALMRCGIDHEMLSDRIDIDEGIRKKRKMFPGFEHTPEEIRGLIQRCTAGADEWEEDGRRGWRVVLDREGKLAPASQVMGGQSVCRSDLEWEHTAEDTQREATGYWKGEVEKARSFVAGMIAYEKQRRGVSSGECGQHQHGNMGDGSGKPALLKQARSRPTLGQVLEVLESMSDKDLL